jgi:CRP/FNR family transcriptional regulator, cyclic AMP receptor protein
MAVDAADLGAIPLFSSLSERDLEQLAAWFDTRMASKGVQLTGEGAPGYSFFVLAEGEAVVSSSGTQIATLGPGDFFGEMAILGDGRRKATVTATTPARLFFMFGTAFRRLQQSQPEVAQRLEAAMVRRQAEIEQHQTAR